MKAEPWEEEPESKEWESSGLLCRMKRGPYRSWCAYVGIPNGHPLWGVGYSEKSPLLQAALERRMSLPIGESPSFAVLISALSGELDSTPDTVFVVHGGITYARDYCPGHEADGLWWYGFDCSHAGDYSPGLSHHEDETYRDEEYVTKETEGLAKQLGEIGGQSE